MAPHPSRPSLAVFGDIVLDIIVFHGEDLAWGSDSRARIRMSPGGSAANVAAWAARLGADVGFFGQAGDDLAGRQLKVDLAAEGVAVDPPGGNLLLQAGEATGIVVVNVQGGERTMVTDRGANLTVPPDVVGEEALARRQWLHLTGYSFFESGPREAALRAVTLCRRAGRPFSVDPSSYRLLAEYGPERFLEEIEGAAALFPNREEAATLTGLDDPRQAAAALAARLYGGADRGRVGVPPVVVVKLGPEGCVVAVGERVEPVRVAGRRPLADPTGAGDAFAAGFLRSYVPPPGSSVLERVVRAARAGVRAASLAIGGVGARPPLRPPAR